MNLSFQGKVALVTGAVSGMGLTVVQSWLKLRHRTRTGGGWQFHGSVVEGF